MSARGQIPWVCDVIADVCDGSFVGHSRQRRQVEASAEPDLVGELAEAAYDAVVERGVLVAVEAFDWNCPQHITQRFTVAEIAALMPLRDRASVDDDCCA